MAESEANQTTEPLAQDGGEKHLKHLDFVQSAVIYFVVCFSTVYEYAKENSGPLKPGVQTVESTVKTVIGPVYERFQDVPFEVLKFVDLKVDDTLKELNRHVPSLMKQASSQAMYVAQKVPDVARELASEVQSDGLVNTATNIVKTVYAKYEPTAKELYINYEPLVERYAVSTWQALNRLPLFPQVAHIVVPTAVYFVEKYNDAVYYTVEKGYSVSQYLPVVPVEKIAKVFKEGGNGHTDEQTVAIET